MNKPAILLAIQNEQGRLGKGRLVCRYVPRTRDVLGHLLHLAGTSDKLMLDFDAEHLGRSGYFEALFQNFQPVWVDEYGMESVSELKRLTTIYDVYGWMGVIRLLYNDPSLPNFED